MPKHRYVVRQPALPTDATHEAFRGGGGRETGAGDVASPSFGAGSGTNPGIGRWSAGRRRPLRHWGCASRVAGPMARPSCAGRSLRKGLAKGASQAPMGSRKPLAPPGAPSPRFGEGEEKGEGRTRRPKTKNTGG